MRQLKVLLVDDDKVDTEPAPHRVLGRGRGRRRPRGGGRREAIELCRTFEPDLVFLDYWMPSMDGAARPQRIRDLHPEARIVAFSGVLDEKPEWADDLYIKGDLPDLELVIDLTRS